MHTQDLVPATRVSSLNITISSVRHGCASRAKTPVEVQKRHINVETRSRRIESGHTKDSEEPVCSPQERSLLCEYFHSPLCTPCAESGSNSSRSRKECRCRACVVAGPAGVFGYHHLARRTCLLECWQLSFGRRTNTDSSQRRTYPQLVREVW